MDIFSVHNTIPPSYRLAAFGRFLARLHNTGVRAISCPLLVEPFFLSHFYWKTQRADSNHPYVLDFLLVSKQSVIYLKVESE